MIVVHNKVLNNNNNTVTYFNTFFLIFLAFFLKRTCLLSVFTAIADLGLKSKCLIYF